MILGIRREDWSEIGFYLLFSIPAFAWVNLLLIDQGRQIKWWYSTISLVQFDLIFALLYYLAVRIRIRLEKGSYSEYK